MYGERGLWNDLEASPGGALVCTLCGERLEAVLPIYNRVLLAMIAADARSYPWKKLRARMEVDRLAQQTLGATSPRQLDCRPWARVVGHCKTYRALVHVPNSNCTDASLQEHENTLHFSSLTFTQHKWM